MLECKGGRIYTGYATDVQKRFETHCVGKGAKFKTKHDALRLEALIKQKSPAEKRKIVEGKDDFSLTDNLQREI